MPYFMFDSGTVYYCPNCKQHYKLGRVRCLVAHTPGTCCHQYETPVEGTNEARSNHSGPDGLDSPPR